MLTHPPARVDGPEQEGPRSQTLNLDHIVT